MHFHCNSLQNQFSCSFFVHLIMNANYYFNIRGCNKQNNGACACFFIKQNVFFYHAITSVDKNRILIFSGMCQQTPLVCDALFALDSL